MKDEVLIINNNNENKKISNNKIETNLSKKLLNQDPVEQGGPKGLEPTRYGDWAKELVATSSKAQQRAEREDTLLTELPRDCSMLFGPLGYGVYGNRDFAL